ncbi:MAG: TIGR04084 family radical SAM/SPASM domain-containing protein [Candidatus Thorarchaeota archaeon]
MNYHIVLTRRCNLNCDYCHGGEETGPETEIRYDLDELERFLEKDDDPQLMLYGGEPCLRVPLITELMDRFPNARFMLQTNATLLDTVPPDYVRRFHSILVSIDGTKEVTDRYRSAGIYDRVLKNVRWLRSINFTGDIVARMTASQHTDIYRDVRHLLSLQDPSFDHVHWQLNVIWSADDNWTDFDGWVEKSYKPGIRRLVDEWVAAMADGRVEGIVPFIPLVYTLLTGQESTLRCGAGLDTFAVHVDGSIGVCPISPDWDFSIIGDIRTSTPESIRNSMWVNEPCPSCDIYGVCGGRCLFTNRQRLWGDDGFRKICNITRQLVSELEKHIGTIRHYIEEGIVSIDDFMYPEYNNGCEIIP